MMDFYYPHPYIVWESMLANKCESKVFFTKKYDKKV